LPLSLEGSSTAKKTMTGEKKNNGAQSTLEHEASFPHKQAKYQMDRP
jgi:hypothetical protein